MAKTSMAVVMLSVLLTAPRAWAETPQPDVKETVARGLAWLAKEQNRDGSWGDPGRDYKASITALAGTALLMEGSTPCQGKYQRQVRRTVDWFLNNAQYNGLLMNPDTPGDSNKYMFSHGYGLLFLASVCGEGDRDQEKQLNEVMRKAIAFAVRAQTPRGGWGYVSGNPDPEANITVAVLQGLCAARRAGFAVPEEVFERAGKYHLNATTSEGGISYFGHSEATDGRPVATAGAVACAWLGAHDKPTTVNKWLLFAQRNPQDLNSYSVGYFQYHYYLARVVYSLGERGYRKRIPGKTEEDNLKWSVYRATVFAKLKNAQAPEGGWPGGHLGTVLQTAWALTILQVDNNNLPAFAR
jgi:Prenyltransferase and squalene oxidase repeat